MEAVKLLTEIDLTRHATFIGHSEGAELDAKSQPYLLEQTSEKYEFAKDVVALINAGGGVLLLGADTQRAANDAREYISELKPFPTALFDEKQARDTLEEWIYPSPNGIELIRELHSNGEKCTWAVRVPAQRDSLLPFIVAKSTINKKRTLNEFHFGVAERVFDSTRRFDVRDVHTWISQGRNFSELIDSKLSDILRLLTGQPAPEGSSGAPAVAVAPEVVAARVSEAVKHLNAGAERHLTLVLNPVPGKAIPGFRGSNHHRIRELMSNPPRVRETGWDVHCAEKPKLVDDSFLRAGESDRRVLDVYADCTMVFVGLVSRDLLAWGDKDDRRLHPLALIETLFSAERLYRVLLDVAGIPNAEVQYQLRLVGMEKGNFTNYLPAQVGNVEYRFRTAENKAPGNLMEESGQMQSDATGRLTYVLTSSIYKWFGLSEEDIPYVKDSSSGRVVDADAIAKVR